jgi:hypothetical protein
MKRRLAAANSMKPAHIRIEDADSENSPPASYLSRRKTDLTKRQLIPGTPARRAAH